MKFFSNFRVLIVGLVIGVLLMTALAFMFFTRAEVTRAMLVAGDESAGNVLQVVGLNIENEYKNLTSFKEYATRRYREQLKNLVGIVIQQIDSYYALYEKKALSEEDAQRQALEMVEKLRYGNNDYFFVYDRNNVAISHPDPRVKGRDISDFKDDRGWPVLKTLRDEAGITGEGTCTMWWLRLGETNLVPKLLYAQKYAKWDWLIGTGVYIDDVETDARRKMDEIMRVLQDAFAGVKVADTGYFFVFDGQSNMLIHPMMDGFDVLGAQDGV
ncbi:MAG: cache domain-containing protein, partial [Lentisphaerota bacterium]